MKHILKLLLLYNLTLISLTRENTNNGSDEDYDITEDFTNETNSRSSNFTLNSSSVYYHENVINDSDTSEDYHEDVIVNSDKSNSSKKGHKTMCGYEEKLTSMGPKTRQEIVEIMKKRKRNITYSVLTLSDKWLNRKSVRKAIRHALDLWSEVIALDFYEVSNTSLHALIQFEYGVNFRDPSIGLGDDNYGFCKPNEKILQNDSYPAVQILFNSNVKWAYLDATKLIKTTGDKAVSYNMETKNFDYIDTYEYQDILWVALHEIGHAIGINHFNPRQPHAIMNKDYIMPLMSNSTGLSTRHIRFPYVVPRLSLADIAVARNHYTLRSNNTPCIQPDRDLHAKKREELVRKKEELVTKEKELNKKEEDLGKKEKETGKKKEELVKKQEQLDIKEEELRKKEEELRKREEELRKKEEKPEHTFTEDYLNASIKWKDITEDKLSNIVKWAIEIQQDNNDESMCLEIKNKLDNKYGDYWHCFYGKINDWYYRPTDSYVHFKFKEMDDKRLIIYRTEGETFLHFNQTQIRNSIFRIHFAEEHEEKQDKAVKWLEEALNKFTDANGKERNGQEICTFMRNNFQSEYGSNWNCIFGIDSNTAVMSVQEQIWFYIYKQFNIIIIKYSNS